MWRRWLTHSRPPSEWGGREPALLAEIIACAHAERGWPTAHCCAGSQRRQVDWCECWRQVVVCDGAAGGRRRQQAMASLAGHCLTQRAIRCSRCADMRAQAVFCRCWRSSKERLGPEATCGARGATRGQHGQVHAAPQSSPPSMTTTLVNTYVMAR